MFPLTSGFGVWRDPLQDPKLKGDSETCHIGGTGVERAHQVHPHPVPEETAVLIREMTLLVRDVLKGCLALAQRPV